jgi:hypothetical protein
VTDDDLTRTAHLSQHEAAKLIGVPRSVLQRARAARNGVSRQATFASDSLRCGTRLRLPVKKCFWAERTPKFHFPSAVSALCSEPRQTTRRLAELSGPKAMHAKAKRNATKDLSSSLLWTPFAPISDITDENREPVAKWLEDRSALLTWFTSIITASLVLVTVFGRKPGFVTVEQVFLFAAVLFLFLAILLNLICVWQIPKWKFGVRTAQVSNGRRMMWDLEISSWVSLISFLIGLVLAIVGNL